jgi:hypothetical protein
MDQTNTAEAGVEDVLEEEVAEQIETPDTQTSDQTETQPVEATEPEEVEITIAGESPSQTDTDAKSEANWVKELRKAHRDALREKRELESKLKALEAPKQETVLGKKPTLHDLDYDAEKYEAELEAWHDRKRKVEAEIEVEAQKKAAEQEGQKARLAGYHKAKAELKVADFQDAEDSVVESLNVSQQAIIVNGSDNSAVVIYALGKNPKKLKELSEITDPVKFSFAVAKLEAQLKITPKTKAPPPETKVVGTASLSAGSDNHLEKLRSEAERTGDYSKVHKYKLSLRK